MGMVLPFDDNRAELFGLGYSTAGRLFFGRVIHKTFISVTETGTRAGAATVIEIRDKAAGPCEHEVVLDRPFVYMLIDTETNTPFFIGVLNDIG